MVIAKMAYGVLVMLSTVASEAVASCNSEQKEACRKSAIDNSLDALTSGGQCLVRQYVQFTHVCTVTNYLPSTDSCCCVDETLVLCCRYHQDWNHFRCVESDDTVHQFQDNATMSMHLKLVIPLVLLAIVIVFFILLCPVLKLLRCRSNSSSSAISRLCSSAWSSVSDANSHKSSATSRCAPSPTEANAVQLIPVSRPVHPRRNSLPESHLSSAEEGSQTVLIPLVCSSPPQPPTDHLRTGGCCQPEQYRVCHLAIDGGTSGAAGAPVILIGCNGGGGAHARCDDDDARETTQTTRSAVERIYVALQRPPTYEEATATRTRSTPETEARTSTTFVFERRE